MNSGNLVTTQQFVNFVRSLIQQYRVEIGQRPQNTPVTWKGIDMTVDEAKFVIRTLEQQKFKYQQAMNDTQTGGEITKLAAGGAGAVAMATGVALMLFPPTMLAGAIVLASGVGAAELGKMVGDGVTVIGTNNGLQAIQRTDTYIDSIKKAINA